MICENFSARNWRYVVCTNHFDPVLVHITQSMRTRNTRLIAVVWTWRYPTYFRRSSIRRQRQPRRFCSLNIPRAQQIMLHRTIQMSFLKTSGPRACTLWESSSNACLHQIILRAKTQTLKINTRWCLLGTATLRVPIMCPTCPRQMPSKGWSAFATWAIRATWTPSCRLVWVEVDFWTKWSICCQVRAKFSFLSIAHTQVRLEKTHAAGNSGVNVAIALHRIH